MTFQQEVMQTRGTRTLKGVAEDAVADFQLIGISDDLLKYELWFEDVDDDMIGVIDMGDTWGAVYQWSQGEGEWWLTTREVDDALEDILRVRRQRGGRSSDA